MSVEAIARSIEVVTPDLIELRRDLHASPELSWHEERTTDVVAGWMDKLGLVHERFEGTGWRGLQETVAGAVARGELDAHVDVLHLLELAIGACLAATLIRGPEALDDDWVESTTRLIVEGVRRR